MLICKTIGMCARESNFVKEIVQVGLLEIIL